MSKNDDSYSESSLESIARCMESWDKAFPSTTSRTERFMRKEFFLLFQLLMTIKEPNPLNPRKTVLAEWLELAQGLDVHSVRREILQRLRQLTGSEVFLDVAPRPEKSSYPDMFHLIFWRKYSRLVFERSRKCFEAISTADVLEAETNTIPYYRARSLIPQSSSAVRDVFDESHAQFAQLLSKSASSLSRPLRVLEVGCGEGRLLRELRRVFPEAKMVGTNILSLDTMQADVLADSNIEIINSPVEGLPFQNESFDVFVSTEVVEHLVDPTIMAKQAFRLLRPGGVFLVSAPSLHVQFLSGNPITYLFGVASLFFEWLLPPFHNLYEPLTNLPIVHYAFSIRSFRSLFISHFKDCRIFTTRFTHLRKFKIEKFAGSIPLLSRFGGVVVVIGKKSTSEDLN